MRAFLHTRPFYMQLACSSNHEILYVLILQMKMSLWVVNPKEGRLPCSSVSNPVRQGRCVSVETQESVWGSSGSLGFSLLSNLKNCIFFSCLFQHGTPPLLIAAGCGNIQILQLLIKRGSRIDIQDKVIILFYCKRNYFLSISKCL